MANASRFIINLFGLGRILFLFLLLGVSTGCSAATTERETSTQDKRTDRVEESYAQQDLLQEYGESNYAWADVCSSDAQCDGPLRCLKGECLFPPAMTGDTTVDLPRVEIETSSGRYSYRVELASTQAERQKGLMYRRHMHADFGMLFLFPEAREQSFWMKNTYLSLDMVFIRENGTVDSFLTHVPPETLSPRRSRGPAKFVLELRAGEVDRIGLKRGDAVQMLGLPFTESSP